MVKDGDDAAADDADGAQDGESDGDSELMKVTVR